MSEPEGGGGMGDKGRWRKHDAQRSMDDGVLDFCMDEGCAKMERGG